MENIKVAAVCMNAAPGEIEKNLMRIQSFVLKAAANGADMVCFPELSVTGYVLNRPSDVYKAMDPGKVLDQLIHMARESGVVLIVGLIEISEGRKPYITQMVTGPEGLMGLYRKTHLSPAEENVYQAGQQIMTFIHGNTTFGVQLCYEAHFPEISTLTALMGADVLFIPHASPRHLTARAFDNGVFLVACNQAGKTSEGFSFPGVALALRPDGQILARYAGKRENILFAELEAAVLQDIRQHRMKYFLPQRRPDLYRKIADS
ncbi:MAG: nitrilase [Deltaproteobacteria bacterium]|nr:nitrilase [Deltaproteobacteria bacterium]